MKRILTALILAGAAFGAFADTISEAVFTLTPKMTCANCEKKIKSNLRFEKGVKNIETSIPEQEVRIKFVEGKTTEENLIKAFKKIGYTAVVKVSDDAAQ